MSQSLVYSNIRLYRSVMNLLYRGGYRRRFQDVIDQIGTDTRSVCELCFGDTLVAEWCRDRGIAWTGVDLNPYFCARARRLGFTVLEGDLLSTDPPAADVWVMAGSLYHFHARLDQMFDVIWRQTPRFILSEPVRNLSAEPGLIGWWARRSANPGDGHATFRYQEQTLIGALKQQQNRHRFALRVVSSGRDLVAVMDRTAPAGT